MTVFRPWRCRWMWVGLVTWTAGLGITAIPAADSGAGAVQDWLDRQVHVITWAAELRQTRQLKSLTQPLVTAGRVWFKAPNLFRWELGDPARTIAIREPERLVLLYPSLKRAEIYPLTGEASGPWRSSLALLEAGFPRDREQMESRFQVVSEQTSDGVLQIELQPREAEVRQWISRVAVSVSLLDLGLVSTELEFSDGSRLRNDFTNVVVNPDFDEDRLRAAVPGDYAVVQPARR